MKKGYGLIEVLVTLFIISILMVIEVDLVTKESIRYKRNIALDREECYCNGALHFVENEINDIKNKGVIIEDNNIVLKKENGDNYTIKSEENNGKYKLVILYDKVIDSNINKNIIVEDLKSVKIKRNKNVVYIYLESLQGKKFYRCIGLNQNIEDI